jgi:mannose-6-phosphate isomerase
VRCCEALTPSRVLCVAPCALASQVASLGSANTGAAAEAGRPYAELWLGTHPSGPARLPGACGRRAPLADGGADHARSAVLFLSSQRRAAPRSRLGWRRRPPSASALTWRRASAATCRSCSRRERGVPPRFRFALPLSRRAAPQVLSVATALSIQAHPDKALAARLFAERPDVYKARRDLPRVDSASS